MAARCVVLLVAVVASAAAGQAQAQVLAGDSCVLGDRAGTCQVLRQCAPLWNVLVAAGRPMPPSVRALLDAAHCGYQRNDPLVCCLPTGTPAGTQTGTPAGTQTATPTPLSSDAAPSRSLPDVSNHKNLALLPTDCGHLDENRIFGGNATGIFEFPWMVLLEYITARGRRASCGATLITPRYALTAAHCVSRLGHSMRLAGAVLGEHDVRADPDCEREEGELLCKDAVQNIDIEESIPHESYSSETLHDDIALVRLARAVDLSTDSVKAICLPTSRELQTQDLAPLKMVVAGWGATEDGMTSPVLLQVSLPTVSTAECQRVYNGSAHVDARQICAGGEPDRDSCGGDSGGPLMYPGQTARGVRYVQHGIVSFGHRSCGVGGFPGVYTRLAAYVGWILDHIRE